MPLTVKFRDIRKGHSLMFTGLGTSEGMEEEERELLFPLRVHRVLYSKDNGSIYMYYIILGGIPLRAICRLTGSHLMYLSTGRTPGIHLSFPQFCLRLPVVSPFLPFLSAATRPERHYAHPSRRAAVCIVSRSYAD